ncbi:baeRF2 domain-containing protein [Streptomyces phaeoluteigriseus]|uniref:baeRF2 domain-containing protein n=1 Tax=Streptomyces phaeoluteigriseus TaxID=114686 RepID=UPI00367A378B
MKLSFLDPLFREPGPWASVYVDTSRDTDDPDAAIDRRRRHQTDALLHQGADPATVTALAGAVGTDRALPGRHGQALFAAHGHLVLVAELPEPPARDTARLDGLPDVAPLAVQHTPDIPYLAVALTRSGERPWATAGAAGAADQDNVPGDHVLALSVAGRWPTGRVTPHERLSHQVPAEAWQRTAPRIARELGDLAEQHRAESIVLCRHPGDVRMSGVLVNRFPAHLRSRVTVVDDDSLTTPEAVGATFLEEHVGRVLEGCLSAADERQLEDFLAQRARHPHRSEGLAAAVSALRRGQAGALLLTRRARLPARVWLGSEPSQIALSASDLEAFGVTSPREEPADAALLYAAHGTGAELVVPPPDRVPSADGVGVLLRYRYAPDR